jgi:hypothetical protein
VPRRTGLAVLALLVCAAAAGPARAADASWKHPIAALSYYSSSDLPVIANAMKAAEFPRGTPIYYGNYWGTAPSQPSDGGDDGGGGGHGNHHTPAPVLHAPGARSAPILGWTPNKFWDGRRLESSDERRLSRYDRGHRAGEAPSLYTLLASGGSRAYGWGRELGRRFRDRMREVEAFGDDVDRWQFDEVPTNAVGKSGRKARDLIRGMLDGVTYGRGELGDRKLRGVVFMANETLKLAARPVRGELKRFWRTVDRDSLALAGEEYPRFVGNPRRSAFVQSGGQRAMARRGGVLGRLAAKYVTALTPGYIGEPGLGGNTGGRSSDGAEAWRADFLAARAQYGVAGFAAYDMHGENGRRRTVRPLFKAISAALRELGEDR